MRAALIAVLAACGGHAATAPDACARTQLYLNSGGGDYAKAGHDDATANLSVLLDGPRTLPAWPRADAEWMQLTACIRTGLAQFPIDIVEQEPAGRHVEIVFTTVYWGDPATAMVVPASCVAGHQIEFVFSDALPPTYSQPCREALIGFAEMTALLSLVGDCHDVVNRAQDCSPARTFLDQDAACVDGTNQPAPCRCGGNTEDTFRAMTAAHPACTPG